MSERKERKQRKQDAMPEAVAKPERKPAPEKTPPTEVRAKRRAFLRKTLGALGWGGLAGSFAGGLAGMARFFFPRVRYEPATRFQVGRADDYVVNTVDSRWLKERNLFVIRKPDGLYAMRGVCTHLGCSVGWFELERKFKCPCHGSFFDIEGDVIGGPAPEPLNRVAVTQDLDGSIRVDLAESANKPETRKKAPFLLKV